MQLWLRLRLQRSRPSAQHAQLAHSSLTQPSCRPHPHATLGLILEAHREVHALLPALLTDVVVRVKASVAAGEWRLVSGRPILHQGTNLPIDSYTKATASLVPRNAVPSILVTATLAEPSASKVMVPLLGALPPE